jgi:solute carrier family 25 protein 34/35
VKKPAAETLPAWQSFLFSTVAPQFAVLFTNPFDTAKVRLQLQHKGERVYNNSFDCIRKIYQNEGLVGLQKGLTPAILREGSKNLFRIGMFDPLIQWLHDKQVDGNHVPLWKRVIAGGASGAMGAVACNPFELVKTRMQSNAKDTIAVGHQHGYTGTFQGLYQIVSREGFWALYKGSAMSVIRSTMGSGCNMALYTGLRDYLLENNLMPNNAVTDAFSGLVSSFFCALIMNPVDVARTRLYNQPKDQYKNGIDVMVQLIRNEGVSAFMKGFLPSFARLGPHFTLTFVFYEQMKRMAMNYNRQHRVSERKQELIKLFNEWDSEQRGKLSTAELSHMMKFVFPPSVNDMFLTNLQHQQYLAEDLMHLTQKYRLEDEIDFETFDALTKQLELSLRDHHLKAAFKFFDRNGDGMIDKAELNSGLAALEFPHPSDKDGHLKASKISLLTERLLELGDPKDHVAITYAQFGQVHDEIQAIQIKKQSKVDAAEHTTL